MNRDNRTAELWQQYRMADDDLQGSTDRLSSMGPSRLRGILGARGADTSVVNRYFTMGAPLAIRSALVELILVQASEASRHQRALFASLGAVGARAVRPALPEFTVEVINRDPGETDFRAVLQLLWCFRQFNLVGDLLSWLLGHRDPDLRVEAADFIDDHTEAATWITEDFTAGRLSPSTRGSTQLDDNDEPSEELSRYGESLFSINQAVRRIRDAGSGDVAQQAVLEGASPLELGRFMAQAMFGEPEQISTMIRRLDGRFADEVLMAFQDKILGSAQYTVNTLTIASQAFGELSISAYRDSLLRSIRSAYGEFDRHGWLVNPRE